ncbi:IS982 family transposase [Phormidesmis priestleyi ULC007]|uniref:IS982 family transposase n=1 Tax=Phormidesmis priestleyi ULC007 TaxID=1920490 RepID=A0A2T1D5J4_9CYAN|nr:IS982 family transposase [Phormidesmis priestleyi]PSB15749.1 IS982 family transposase [Phormidesmis priestleyi ULC007]
MLPEIIAIYAITDDLLKAIGHQEDVRVQLSDAEVITTALVSARFFGGNHQNAQDYLKEPGLMPKMLSKSRFNRRLHRLFLPLLDLFDCLGMVLKSIHSSTESWLDSFPVPLCDNIRIPQVRLVRCEDYRGYIASKKRYFYDIRVQLLATADGIPVEFAFLPGEANDVRGLNALPLSLPANSEIYADAAYTDYKIEDALRDTEAVTLQVARKRNSKRPDSPALAYIKQTTRHFIETVFSGIPVQFPKAIHAVTMDGFLLKVSTFIVAFTLKAAFID